MGILTACLQAYAVGNYTRDLAKICPRLVMGLMILFVLGIIVYYFYRLCMISNHKKCKFVPMNVLNNTFIEQGPRYEGFKKVRIGSHSYKVHEDLSNPVKAAEVMHELNKTATKLIIHLNQKYIDNDLGLDNIKPKYKSIVKKGIKALKRNFRSANMEENIPERSGGDTSYVIDKGDVFAMCLRDPKQDNQLMQNYNDLVFVLIHEMAHLFTSTYGHDNLFWNNFKFLLQESIEAGLYRAIDYKRIRSPYCGIVISYSPLFDPKLSEYKENV